MLPTAFWVITLFILGACVGSFLTAVIYRLGHPEKRVDGKRMSLLEPQRSMCPKCGHSLHAVDLLPLFSFLMFGRKCHYCKAPISWRYFGVELLTGLTFVALYFKFPLAPPEVIAQNAPTLAAMLAFAATLIPIFFIDLETYTIPISLTLLTTVIPLCLDVWQIAHHRIGFEPMMGWLPRSLAGWILGTLILGFIRVVGWVFKRQEAMGLGDVFLVRGMGAMFLVVMPIDLSYWSFFLLIVLSSLGGILVYPMMLLAQKQNEKNSQKVLDRYGNSPSPVETTGETSDNTENIPKSSLAEQLRDVGLVMFAVDAYDWTMYTFNSKYRQNTDAKQAEETARYPELEEWTPAPTAIPFGPFLVLGFLLTLFWAAPLVHAYLAFAHLTPESTVSGTTTTLMSSK